MQPVVALRVVDRLDVRERGGVGKGGLALVERKVSETELALCHDLGEVEELADVGGSLGTKTAGLSRGGVGKSGNILLTLLDDHEVEDSKIGTDDAATDGLALTLTLRDRRDKRRGNTARRAR